MTEPREIEVAPNTDIYTPVGEWKRFLDSSIWLDISEVLDDMIEVMRLENEALGLDSGATEAIRGQIKAVRHLRNLPQLLLEMRQLADTQKEQEGDINAS